MSTFTGSSVLKPKFKLFSRLFVVTAMAMQMTACAGLMMHVDELDAATSGIHLTKGSTVAVDLPDVAEALKGQDEQNSQALTAQLQATIKKELADSGVTVTDKSPNKINVRLQRYVTGNAFFRGFFPVFHLGDSYFDGTVALRTKDGQRSLVINKIGQTSGIGAMGDQTAANIDYFAKTLVSHLVIAPQP